MLNDIPTTGQLRQPRGIVRVFNTADAALAASLSTSPTSALSASTLSGWKSWSVTNNSYYEADTFHVEFAANGLPAEMDPAWFSSLTADTFIEIFAGFPVDPTNPTTDDTESLIYGRIDDIEYDPVATTLTLTGRDLTGVFIDSKIASDYPNKTSSQIANMLAAKYGITANVTTTKPWVGTYYQIDHVLLQAHQSEWDLLCYLARREGFVVFVSGQTLYFGPDPRETADSYAVQWTPPTNGGPPSANAVTLSFSRNMTVAKGIAVEVSCTNLNGAAIKQSYPTAARDITPGKASPYGPTTVYRYTLSAGHSAVDCEQYAQQKYQQIASHAMKVKGEMPGDNLLSVQVPLTVSGTQTDWDQTYFVMSVTREMSVEEGYSMSFEAQNTTPDLDAAAQSDSATNTGGAADAS